MSSTETGHELQKQIRRGRQQYDIHLAIAGCETPPTRKDLQLLTHRPETQVRRLLSELQDRGIVRRYRDPDDRRVFRYDLIEHRP